MARPSPARSPSGQLWLLTLALLLALLATSTSAHRRSRGHSPSTDLAGNRTAGEKEGRRDKKACK